MSTLPDRSLSPSVESNTNVLWIRRFLISLTVFTYICIAAVAIWIIGLIITPILLMIIALLIAYLLYPLVKFLNRFMPRVIAILITYLGVLFGLLIILGAVFLTAIGQLFQLMENVKTSFPMILRQLKPLTASLQSFGISPQQFQISGQQLLNKALSITSGLLPLVTSVFTLVISCIIITSVSIYFLADGQQMINWLRHRTPLRYREQIGFFLDTLDHTMGGFVRGQFFLAALISGIEGLVLFILGVPYAILLAVIVFLFEFVPQIGSYISASIVILLTLLTSGWQIGLVVAVFSTILQGVVDGQILAPRIIGHSVGLHPILSLFALLVGAALFGLAGAVFAVPITGIAQVLLQSFWHTWKRVHPEQFPDEQQLSQPERPTREQRRPALDT
jgi:predicted PurR-regulated permease PerM